MTTVFPCRGRHRCHEWLAWLRCIPRGRYPRQGLTALAADVGLAPQNTVVANAGELVGAAGAAVAEASQMPRLKSADVEIVAAFGDCAEQLHDVLPFRSMWLDARAV